ncbi:MAG: thiol-activated cytolysin family protein [Ignavibacteria bacterium]|jgi:hypothetical protein|nr:thiol-activated cytolysin family protein [Ignavibacteria bacterium]
MKKRFIFPILLLLVLVGCSDSNDPNDNDTPSFKNVDELVEWAGKLPNHSIVTEKYPISTSKKTEVDNNSGIYYTSNTTDYYSSREYTDIVNVTSQNGGTLYPGSIVRGKDIEKGLLSPISYGYSRQPITLTMPYGGGSISVDNPNLSNVNNALNELIAQKKPIATCMDYQLSSVYSSAQSMMDLGLDIGWGFLGASGMYGEEKSYTKHSILLYFKQVYYTITMDGSDCVASRIFASDVDVNKLAKETGKDNPLCVVSGVDYGRIIIVKVTSTDSYEEMQGQIKLGFKNIGGSYSASKTSKLQTYEYSAQVIGGNANSSVKAINGIDGVFEAINEGKDYTQGNPGYPIAFRVSYLVDGSLAKTGKDLLYAADNWAQKIGRYSIRFDRVKLLGTDRSYNYINPKYRVWVTNGDSSIANSGFVDKSGVSIYVGGYITINSEFTIEIPITTKTDIGLNITLLDNNAFGNDYVVTSTKITWYTIEGFMNAADGIMRTNYPLLTPTGTNWKTTLDYKITELQ